MALAAALGLCGVLFCLFDWRRGLLLCIAVGFLQDPLRKIVPGQPVAFVVLVGVFFVGCALGFLFEQGPSGFARFFRWYPGLKAPIVAFVALIALSAAWAIATTGSAVVAGIGLLSYLSPLIALFLGHQYGSTASNIGRWQKAYLLGALAVASSILLAFAGVQSQLFASIGDTTVYGRGGRVEMVSGLLRSSENSSWHAATAACLVLTWSVARRRSRAFWIGVGVTLGLLLAVVLTGRRKTLGEVLLFVIVFGFFLGRARLGATRLLRVSGSLAFGAAAAALLLTSSDVGNQWNPYIERSVSVVQDAPERLRSMALGNLVWVVRENGFFGRGAGTGAQGAQYFGGGAQLVGWGAEGGLGRITAELGVPGLLVAFWISIAIGVRLWRVATRLPERSPRHAVRVCGLVSLVPANAVVFLTAHQVFGDPFVLIVLGLVTSSALAYPQVVHSELAPPAPSLRRLALAPTLRSQA